MSEPMSDSKFSRNFIGMIIAMIIMTGALMVLASLNANEVNENLKAEKDAEKAVALTESTSPLSKVNIGEAVASIIPEAQAEEVSGESVYNGACAACHAAGIAGAPTTGDNAQWAPRIAKGIEALYASANNGIGAMPAKGGQSLSDEEVNAAVDFMVAASE